MVHALEKIHSLLAPGGFLLDIHPSPQPPPIEVRVGERFYLAGWLKEADDYVEYIQADAALKEVIEQGLFALEKEGSIQFNTHTDTLEDLQAHLKENWEDAILDSQVAGRVEDLWGAITKDKELILREIGQVARLRPL